MQVSGALYPGQARDRESGEYLGEIKMKHWLEAAGALLYPPRCPVCDELVGMGVQRMCPACRRSVRYLSGPLCCKCGKRLSDREAEYCGDCGRVKHLFSAGRALYEYGDIAPALYRFKYGGRREYAGFFAREMAQQMGGFIRSLEPGGLVPVPMYAAKERRRGYNQAALLARALGRELNIPVFPKLVIRNRNTRPLKSLNSEERVNNLKKAFNLAQNGVKLKTIILIDDIFTTGSTIDQVSAVLLSGGCQRVYFATLAIGAGV